MTERPESDQVLQRRANFDALVRLGVPVYRNRFATDATITEVVERHGGAKVNYPIIADHDLNVSKLYNMLPANAGDTSEGRTAATNATVRTVYMIGPDKLIKAMLIYPMSTGRNFDEVLRLLDSIQLTAKHSVATPVNWKQGEDCIIVPSLSDEAAREKFPNGWKTVKPYLRTVPQPGQEESAERKLEVPITQ